MLHNRQEVIGAFKTGFFLHINGFQIKKDSEEELEEELKEELEEKKLEKNKRWL